ncbi:MAG: leucine-rich repeat domain-containing protein, partial [Bacteroidales bacterium]
MKKKLLFLLLIMQLTLPLTTLAGTITVNDIIYETNDDDMTASITGYSGDKPTGDLVLPNTVTDAEREYTVTSIGFDAFYYCSSLTSIDLPDNLTEIGSWAFAVCTSLTAIDLPDSLTEIGTCGFRSCTSLTTID